jgi:hypothetical protein
MITAEPFTMLHDGKLYKISFNRKEGDKNYLNAENVETGEIHTFPVLNYSADSGNAHLRYSLEGRAADAYVGAMFRLFEKIHGLEPLDTLAEVADEYTKL